jgi:hypothetical protein
MHLTSGKSRLTWRVTHSSSSNFTFEQPLFREFQDAVNLFASNSRKLIEKLDDRFAFFDTVKQVSNWNASPSKNRNTAHLFGIHFDQTLRTH